MLALAEDSSAALAELTGDGVNFGYHTMAVMAIGRDRRDLDITLKGIAGLYSNLGYGVVREVALQIELSAAQGIVSGYDLLRCGHGGGAKVYKDMARHQVLFAEMVDFMQQRNRTSLCWTGLDIEDAVTKYKDRLVYVGRVLFPKKAEKTGQQGGEQ